MKLEIFLRDIVIETVTEGGREGERGGERERRERETEKGEGEGAGGGKTPSPKRWRNL